MRPSIATFKLASAFTVPDDADPVDWTDDSLRLTPVIAERFCDETNNISISALDTKDIILRAGVYEVTMEVHAESDAPQGQGNKGISIAITDGAGVVLDDAELEYFIKVGLTETDPLVDDTSSGTVCVRAIVELTTDQLESTTSNIINFRAAQSTGTGNFTIHPASIGMIEKITNAGQS